MIFNKLGSTDLLVSQLGFGTAQIGGPSIINGKPFGAKSISNKVAHDILTLAYDNGVNFYDSSDLYGDGLAERRIGEFFYKKEDIYFATKTGFTNNGKRSFNKKYIFNALEKSLINLKREQIELFQLSKPTKKDFYSDDILYSIEKMKQSGKIKYAGISVGNLEDANFLLEQNIFDTFQIMYNLLSLEWLDFIQKCKNKNIGVIIKSPLSSGMLSGKFGKETVFDETDDRSAFLKDELLDRRCNTINKIKNEYKLSNNLLLEFSLKFLLSHESIDTIIPGATSVSQMKNNLNSVNINKFNTKELKDIISFLENL